MKMKKHYSLFSRGLFLKLLLLLGLIIGIIVFKQSSKPSVVISSTALVHHSTTTCNERLDELDRTFDKRRNARIELIGVDHEPPLSMYDLYEPEAVCFSDERFGSEKRYTAFGDGPKFLCGVDVIAKKSNSSEGCLVYSIGSNNDISFEKGIKNFMVCETHTFDPTLDKPFVGDEYAIFHPWGLGTDGEFMVEGLHNWTAKSMDTIVHELGHRNRIIDVMKIDCEGCEWAALPPLFNAISDGGFKVDQLLVEVHFPPSPEALAAVFLAADKAKLRVFHKERNSWGHWNCCIEYAFVSESFLREANGELICPGEDTSASRL